MFPCDFFSSPLPCMKQRFIVTFFAFPFFTDVSTTANMEFSAVCFKFQQRMNRSIFHGLLRSICIFMHNTHTLAHRHGEHNNEQEEIFWLQKEQTNGMGKQDMQAKRVEMGFVEMVKTFVFFCCFVGVIVVVALVRIAHIYGMQ